MDAIEKHIADGLLAWIQREHWGNAPDARPDSLLIRMMRDPHNGPFEVLVEALWDNPNWKTVGVRS